MRRLLARDPLHDVPDELLRAKWKRLIWYTIMWLLGIAAAIYLGGPDRMSSPSYQGMRDITDLLEVSVLWWAAPPALAGAALTWGLLLDWPWARVTAYAVGLVVAGGLVTGFTYSLAGAPTAGATAIPTYLFVAFVIFELLAVAGEIGFRRGASSTRE